MLILSDMIAGTRFQQSINPQSTSDPNPAGTCPSNKQVKEQSTPFHVSTPGLEQLDILQVTPLFSLNQHDSDDLK